MIDYTALALGISPLPEEPTFLQAVVSSHSQETDGFVIGGSLAANFIALLGISDPLVGYLNGTCVPGTGITGGIEVVYDFKHQERGLFRYHGGVLNLLSWGNVGGVGYMGLTRGFSTQPYGTALNEGVGAYGGYFGATDVGLSGEVPEVPSPNAGGVFIEASPLLEETRNINPQGVFATYLGISAGGGTSVTSSSVFCG